MECATGWHTGTGLPGTGCLAYRNVVSPGLSGAYCLHASDPWLFQVLAFINRRCDSVAYEFMLEVVKLLLQINIVELFFPNFISKICSFSFSSFKLIPFL